VDYDPCIPITALFVLFMTGMNFRMAPYQTLISKVPAPNERASFMSLMGAVQHFSTSTGAVFSSVVLSTGPGGELVGMARLGLVSMVIAALVPPPLPGGAPGPARGIDAGPAGPGVGRPHPDVGRAARLQRSLRRSVESAP
jgi:hypothetical protein